MPWERSGGWEGACGQAPADASYVLLANDPSLSADRALGVAAGELTLTDGGAGGAVTLGLASTAVTPGSYSHASVTVDARGRITAASSGTAGDVSGPGSSTSNALATWNGTSGISLSNNTWTLSGSTMTAPAGGVLGFVDANTRIYESSDNLHVEADLSLYLSPDDDVVVRAGTTEYVRFDGSSQAVAIAGSGASAFTPGNALHVKDSTAGATALVDNIKSTADKIALTCKFSSITTVGTSDRWVAFYNSSSLLGAIRGNGDSTTVVYASFAGQHDGQVAGSRVLDGELYDGTGKWRQGMILVATGALVTDGRSTSPHPKVALARKALDPAVVGIYAGSEDTGSEQASFDKALPVVHYSALGHGKVLVTTEGGEVNVGDLVTTSSVSGYGMKQPDDLIHSYTVCKVVEQIDWNEVVETVGGFKAAMVTCFVYCG